MNRIFNKIAVVVVVVVFCIDFLSAQKLELVVDTVYSKNLNFDGINLLLSDSIKGVQVNGEELSPFDVHIEGRKIDFGMSYVMQIEDKCYVVNEDLSYNQEKFVYLDMKTLSYKGRHLKANQNYVAYVKEGSVFLANLNTHIENLVMNEAVVLHMNKNYMLIQSNYPEEKYIYTFESKKALKLPPDFRIFKSDHPYFIIENRYDQPVIVKDLLLNTVVSPEENFDRCDILGDLLIVLGNGKPVKIFYKDKLLKFDEEYVDADCRDSQNVCFLTSSEGGVSVIGADGKLKLNNTFDDVVFNTFYQKDIVLRKGKTMKLFDRNLNLIFEGEYDDIRRLNDDRFFVKKDRVSSVVDSEGAQVLSSEDLGYSSVVSFNEMGVDVIKVFNGDYNALYTNDGSKIIEWMNEKGDTFVKSSEYLKGLNWRMVQSLTDTQEQEINPSRVWVVSKAKEFYLVNKSGENISSAFQFISKVNKSNYYIIKTKSGMHGIIKVLP